MDCDVLVVGAGSAGIGAAYQAARAGARVVLVERNHQVGGTTVHAWINNWEPTPGASGLAKLIWETMLPYHPDPPGFAYGASLRSVPGPFRHNLQYPPDLYLYAAEKILALFSNLRILTGTTLVGAKGQASQLKEAVLLRDGREFSIPVSVVVDCTADGNVCAAAGCEFRIGEDARADYDEPHAPERPKKKINALDLIYCVRYEGTEVEFRLPEDISPLEQGGMGFYYECPRGTWYFNRCGSTPGRPWIEEDRGPILARARKSNLAHFDWVRRHDAYFRRCRIAGMAPEIGVRETRRIVCEYMLTERDILTGWNAQTHPDLVAMTDHELDIHGHGHLQEWLSKAYGIPFRCLIPKGWANLLVAGRCAGFTHIAASSCRLSRTMMALGEAAGLAAAFMAGQGTTALAVPPSFLRERLVIDDRKDFVEFSA